MKIKNISSGNRVIQAVQFLTQCDPALKTVIDQVGSYQLIVEHELSMFQAISKTIIYQQLSGKAAGTIHNRFCQLFVNDLPVVESAVVEDVELMKTAGLSRAKANSINHMSTLILSNQIKPEEQIKIMPDQDVINELVKIKGVGAWSAQMVLMHWLGREDVFAEKDLGLKKGIQKIYGLSKMPDEQQALEYAKKWQPYRTYASWYLWRSLEIQIVKKPVNFLQN